MKRFNLYFDLMNRQNNFAIQIVLTVAFFIAVTVISVLTGYSQQNPLSAEKAKMIGYVENFFMHNISGISNRNSLEWGEVRTDENGNSTIRYRFESPLVTGVRQLWCEDFTFDKEGNFVSETVIDGYPKILGEAEDAKNNSAGLSLTHRVVFGAKDDFKVTRFDDIYQICQPAFENANVQWKYAKIDKDENGNQIFQTLTNEPEKVRKVIESLPQFVYIKTEPVTRELFVNHTATWRNRPKMDDFAVTSINDLLNIKILESYRVDKRIVDFPEKFDLSTPENAYATQKYLIISNDKDKIEQLLKLQYEGDYFPERERRLLEQKISEDWQKTYKTKFVVYEVLKFSDDLAFVFALRQFDNLYDGNLFKKKEDGCWYNCGNLQSFRAVEMAENVEKYVEKSMKLFISPLRRKI